MANEKCCRKSTSELKEKWTCTHMETMDYLAIMLGNASRYEVVSKGCIPVGFILKGIYGSTSVTGEFSFLQKNGKGK